jgi:hypothetical protein
VQKKACGESNDIRDEDCEKWKRDVLPSLIENYQPKDVFNADETGLFFKCLPDKTLTFKNEKCHGEKHSKERVTLLLGANMDGSEKLKIFLIGKSKQPRCFRNIRWLPLHYKANSKAWMTAQLFEDWLIQLDRHFKNEGRKIILFVDNCTAHPQDIQKKLQSIKLTFFPPNMTAKLQPLDQGVIKNLKCHYRYRILKKVIEQLEVNKKPMITLKDCVEYVTKSWNIDVKPKTISNCFKKAGFGQYSEWEDEDEIPLVLIKENLNRTDVDYNKLSTEFQSWMKLQNSSEILSLEDYINLDEEICTSEFPTDEDIIENYVSNPASPIIEKT